MATFVLLIHPFDRLRNKKRFRFPTDRYLIAKVLIELRKRGHKVKTARLSDKIPSGDIGILHCDCSVIPESYRNISNFFSYTVNGSVFDISKRFISQASINSESPWDGPVIVKSNYNYFGNPERQHNRRAKKFGRVPPHRLGKTIKKYRFFDERNEVPNEIWENPDLSVERFIPEACEEGYAMRTWTFWGNKGRCRRHVSSRKVIKGHNVIRSEVSEVPECLRETRRKLGFDYGKFDFVMQDGKSVLFDANKTPSISTNVIAAVMKDVKAMGDGFESFLE